MRFGRLPATLVALVSWPSYINSNTVMTHIRWALNNLLISASFPFYQDQACHIYPIYTIYNSSFANSLKNDNQTRNQEPLFNRLNRTTNHYNEIFSRVARSGLSMSWGPTILMLSIHSRQLWFFPHRRLVSMILRDYLLDKRHFTLTTMAMIFCVNSEKKWPLKIDQLAMIHRVKSSSKYRKWCSREKRKEEE